MSNSEIADFSLDIPGDSTSSQLHSLHDLDDDDTVHTKTSANADCSPFPRYGIYGLTA